MKADATGKAAGSVLKVSRISIYRKIHCVRKTAITRRNRTKLWQNNCNRSGDSVKTSKTEGVINLEISPTENCNRRTTQRNCSRRSRRACFSGEKRLRDHCHVSAKAPKTNQQVTEINRIDRTRGNVLLEREKKKSTALGASTEEGRPICDRWDLCDKHDVFGWSRRLGEDRAI